jgi:hypothetical protein
MEIAWGKPLNPIVLNKEQQQKVATLMNWCANNIWKNKAVTDDTKLSTASQGQFYFEQLITSTIPHKTNFKWKRKYNVDVSKQVDALKDNNLLVYLDNLYNFAKDLSANFTKLV